MTKTLDDLCREAKARLAEYISRAAGQHMRYVREGFAEVRLRLGVA